MDQGIGFEELQKKYLMLKRLSSAGQYVHQYTGIDASHC